MPRSGNGFFFLRGIEGTSLEILREVMRKSGYEDDLVIVDKEDLIANLSNALSECINYKAYQALSDTEKTAFTKAVANTIYLRISALINVTATRTKSESQPFGRARNFQRYGIGYYQLKPDFDLDLAGESKSRSKKIAFPVQGITQAYFKQDISQVMAKFPSLNPEAKSQQQRSICTIL